MRARDQLARHRARDVTRKFVLPRKVAPRRHRDGVDFFRQRDRRAASMVAAADERNGECNDRRNDEQKTGVLQMISPASSAAVSAASRRLSTAAQSHTALPLLRSD